MTGFFPYVLKYFESKCSFINIPFSLARHSTLRELISRQKPVEWSVVGIYHCSQITSSARSPSKSDDQERNGMNNFIKQLQTRLSKSITTRQKLHVDKKSPLKDIEMRENPDSLPRKPVFPKPYAENAECDKDILCCVKSRDISEALSRVQRFAVQQKFPKRNTLLKLASICASKADVQGIGILRDVCEVAFPAEVEWQMGFMQYEAEALWKSGEYDKALTMFEGLFQKYPLQRRKLANMMAFYMRHVMNENLLDEYPKLLAFVEKCMEVGEWGPAMNLWRAAFCATSFQAHNLAEELFSKHNTLPGLLDRKIPTVISTAKMLNRIDILQRLIEVLLRFDLKEHYQLVFGAYVNYLCEIEDVDGVIESFDYITKASIIIPASSVQNIIYLLKRHKRKVPLNILNAIFKESPARYQF